MSRVIAVKQRAVRAARLPVSDGNVRKAALRLLGQPLVSTEVQYVQRTLGDKATQKEIDDKIVAVRKMPWASITVRD
jgi:hypothetical protein